MTNDVILFILEIAVLLFSVSVHESAHGWMAEKFGDPTARLQGRITLNPIPHIDPLGSIIFPILLHVVGAPVFGWAKPVQVNPYNLRDRRRAWMSIAAAGPVSNLILALLGILLWMFVRSFAAAPPYGLMLTLLLLININVILAIFNFMPIPPLDGSKILESKLRGEALYNFEKIKPYGFIIFIVVIYSGIFTAIAKPILSFVYSILY